MSLLAMDTSSLFDPFAFDPPEMDPEPKPEIKFREKLEIKPPRHQDHHLKVMMDVKTKQQEALDVKLRMSGHDMQSKVQMLDSPSPTTGHPASDMQSVRQKLRDNLTSALEMVVSKQLVKNVLGVVRDVNMGSGENKSPLKAGGFQPDNPTQDLGSPKPRVQSDDDSLVVDLGLLETDAMNIDANGGDGSVLDYPPVNGGGTRVTIDQVEDYECDVAESPMKKLKTSSGQSGSFNRKLEIEEKEGRLVVEDVKGGLHLMDQARKLATDIEAELFKLYGFKKTYNQKARSLLFNLKDKSNPELRARVFSGEITPADLCRMSAEQLASKELSDWRNAKEQALDKWVVLTDADTVSGKVVKKTHKGEFVVDVQNENTVDIIPLVTHSIFPVNKEKVEKYDNDGFEQLETHISDALESRGIDSPNKVLSGGSPSLKRSRSNNSHAEMVYMDSSNIVEEQISLENTPEQTDAELIEVGQALPTILSLDEYMDAQEEAAGVEEDVFEDAPIEPRTSVPPTTALTEVVSGPHKHAEDDVLCNHSESPGVKAVDASNGLVKQQSDTKRSDKEEAGVDWIGQIQLSSNRQSPLSIIHQSGEKLDMKNWPKSLELKGRVRLAHLDKFLQDLRQSRSRSVTIVTLHVQEGLADHVAVAAHVKEIASQYQMGDRVGFVEPKSGIELYLLPSGNGTMKLLSDNGHSEIFSEARGREVVLVGVIVWRRSQLSSSSSRQPDRNNNVKRQSSTNQESMSKSSRAGAGLGKDPGSDHRSRLRCGATVNVSSALSSMLTDFQVESPTKEELPPVRNWPQSTATNSNVLDSHHVAPTTSIPPSETDAPPGFTFRDSPSVAPRQSSMSPQATGDVPPGFWPRPAQSMPTRQPLSEDDDDLPEFDFGGQTVAGGPPPASGHGPMSNLGRTIPHLDKPPHPSSQFQSSSSPSGIQELCLPAAPSKSEFPLSLFPPRPPAGPPPSQDPNAFVSRNEPQLFNPVGPEGPVVSSVSSMDGSLENEYRPFPQDSQRVSPGIGQGQAMLAQPGPPLSQQPNMVHYMGVNSSPQMGHSGAPPPSNHIPRNDLPEWHPSAQFQLRPPPLYENDMRHMGGAPPRPFFDLAGAPPPPPQDMNWPPPQHPPPLSLQLPPPPQFLQEQNRNFQPMQWPQHSNHFHPQHITGVPADNRGPYGWDAPPWDAGARGREPPRNIERSRDNRSSGDDWARAKDPRSISERERIDFRRR